MTKHDLEALLARMAVAYPRVWRGDEIEARMRVEEWWDSPARMIDLPVAVEAWRRWKGLNDQPPTIHQFVELARSLTPALEPGDDDEPGLPRDDQLRNVRELRTHLAQVTKPAPDDEVPGYDSLFGKVHRQP